MKEIDAQVRLRTEFSYKEVKIKYDGKTMYLEFGWNDWCDGAFQVEIKISLDQLKALLHQD